MQEYNEAKRRNQVVKEFSKSLVSEKMQKRICECGSWLQFIADYDLKKRKLMAADFCKWRFCPMCAMRKARKEAMRISTLMTYINAEFGKDFIFVTLSAPSVEGANLSDEITRYAKAFNKIMVCEEVIKMQHGFVRKLEITHDAESKITKEMYKRKKEYYIRRGLRVGDANPNYDMYHPHLHIVFAVNRGYFSGGRYIKQERWLNLWRHVMGDDSITQVDVRKVKRVADSNDMSQDFDFQVLEFAKYAAKDTDYTRSGEIFDTFYHALKGRQVLTYGGLFAAANKKYKNDELDEYIKADNTVYYWEIVYSWKGEKYNESKRKPLDAGDKLFLAMKGIDTEVLE